MWSIQLYFWTVKTALLVFTFNAHSYFFVESVQSEWSCWKLYGYYVGLKSLWCCDFATERPIHYFLIFTSAYWNFARFIPLTAFGLKSLPQAALTTDVFKAVLLPSFDSWLIPSSLLIGWSCPIYSVFYSVDDVSVCCRVGFSDISC